mmetsp:Transcript_25110/g.34989  ORF Transcript_25110/g.34989 Transcript_25110/m.34989 type:complete len:1188 (-) Transcript_25110:174-3737(-)|eukprot:CAMPEP_0184490934 /NCGR_PEP_ID=MMETSP0113_2-20130426/19243_1 /TAXON_ID=91329 /ORGANISM="Norrisiella sphaerica, Strain BC52" /LENGTH=1187 /DNA_ID=CAMNT_0026875075 /DNA_START=189 /DNA_END=3752 /DNA_ORIENTATION=-
MNVASSSNASRKQPNNSKQLSAPSPSLSLPNSWGEWGQFVEKLFRALLGVYSLFHERGSQCTLEVISSTVERMSGGLNFDLRTLQLLREIYPDVVTYRRIARDERDTEIQLDIGEDPHEGEGKQKAPRYQIILRFDREEGLADLFKAPEGRNKKRRQGKQHLRRGMPPDADQRRRMKRRADIIISVFQKKLRRYIHLRSLSTTTTTAQNTTAKEEGEEEEAEEGENPTMATSAVSKKKGRKTMTAKPKPKLSLPPIFGTLLPNSVGARVEREQWDGSKVTVSNFLRYAKTCEFYQDQLVNTCGNPSSPARYAELRSEAGEIMVPEGVRTALDGLGIQKLYSHQVMGIMPLLETKSRRHVVCTTSTSSGKSMIYTVPMVSGLLRDADQRSLLLFPTKALAHDQLAALRRFCASAGVPNPDATTAAFDGDTRRQDRPLIRDTARIIVTNPDILHCTVLPMHEEWEATLKKVRFIVIDEAHAYTGVFGNHVSLVMRRLLRLCHKYGANPRVVCCSATIANPTEHMVHLTGVAAGDILIVDTDGSPRGARIFGFWNPPTMINFNGRGGKREERRRVKGKREKRTDRFGRDGRAAKRKRDMREAADEGEIPISRRSPYTEAAQLLAELVKHNLRSIVFVKARHVAELVLERARNHLPTHLKGCVASYRSGYLAKERRRLEAGMVDGSLLGMVATNALELGIDIGILDVTLHVGFPGTKSSFLQQAGRAGRGTRDCLSILIAMDCPIDQFLVANPSRLFARELRLAVADPTNKQQLVHHLLAAAWETPLDAYSDQAYFGVQFLPVAKSLVSAGQLRMKIESKVPQSTIISDQGEEGIGDGTNKSEMAPASDPLKNLVVRFSCDTDVSPARMVSIRNVSESESFKMVDVETGRVVETMDADNAPFKLFDGAVYMHQGRTYVVEQLNLEKNLCTAKRATVSYYTEPRHHTRVALLGADRSAVLVGPEIGAGRAMAMMGRHDVSVDEHFLKARLREPVSRSEKGSLNLLLVHAGAVNVSHSMYGYNRRSKGDSKVIERVELNHIPAVEYATKAVWIELPMAVRREMRRKGYIHDEGILHAVEHVIVSLCPLVINCDALDLAGQCTRRDSDPCNPLILLYERQRGGIGVIGQIMDNMYELMEMGRQRIADCMCSRGCLTCIHHPRCLEHNLGLEKQAALELLDIILAHAGRMTEKIR